VKENAKSSQCADVLRLNGPKAGFENYNWHNSHRNKGKNVGESVLESKCDLAVNATSYTAVTSVR